MDALRKELRFALRSLRSRPGFTAVAVMTVALGIGATTSIFSVVRGTLLRPLPYAESDRLVITDNSWFHGPGLVIVAACAITALVLAAIGLHGVIAFSVGPRTHEFGVRRAAGANPGSSVGLVLRRRALQVTVGLALGFALAWTIARGVASLLFNVSPSEPVIFIAFGAFLVLVAFVASLVPALRAARIDPLATPGAE